MTHLIYNVNTLHVVASNFKSKGGATRSLKTKYADRSDLTVTDAATFHNEIDHEVETYNCLDPQRKPIKIRKSQKGTYMDPATERYHSM